MLQAVALREALSDLGHDVRFIDYWPESHAKLYKIWSPVIIKDHKTLLSKAKAIVSMTLLSPLNAMRRHRFNKFFKRYIKPYLVSSTEEIDMAIYGSDQIWARFPFTGNRIDTFYLANNDLKAARHVTYAASMGSVDISDDQLRVMADHIGNFEAISVREEDMRPLLKRIGADARPVCDPTLLLSAERWSELIPKKRLIKEKYALFYDFQVGSFDMESLRRFCESRSLRLVTISAFLRLSSYYSDELGIINPEDFINLIAHADFVFTSSFHGLAFSIIFRRQFYCAYLVKASRAQTLLENIGLSERLISFSDKIDKLPYGDIDYASIEDKIRAYRENSLTFLRSL